MSFSKPYHIIPIHECGESLVSLPKGVFAFAEPHPYIAVGAPYGTSSPWRLRQSVVDSLIVAQHKLHKLKPGWTFKFIDAYRPNAVQAFMVGLAFEKNAKELGLDPQNLSALEREKVGARVFRFWGIPSEDPKTPPPHSTGAAFDLTLADENGEEVDMGCPVDDPSDGAMPAHFAQSQDPIGKAAHANRIFLYDLLHDEGFVQHPSEWWHFSRGDQLAVWTAEQNNPKAFAIYGRVDL